MSHTLSKVLRSQALLFFGRGRSSRRLQALRWSGSELLEQRQLLTAATAAADTELQVYHSTGVNSVSIALPPDAVSFQAITFSPLLGTVVLNNSGPLSVNYEYSSSGVDSFGISYLDAYGSTRTQNVNIIIVDDYTGTDLLDSPDPQGEQDFLGGLYNGFVNSSSGTGGVPTGGSAYYGGNGAGSVLGSGSGGTGGSGGGTSPAPEIAVYGKNLLIVDGDSTPSATDDTDYGIVSSGQFVDHTFTVTNSGTANLSLQLHQLPAGWMITESLSLYLAPGANDSFTVRFAPTSSGQYSTDIIIDNNDADENPYNFVIRGATNAPEIGVSGNGIVIVDGDSTPAIPDGTQFGWINAGQSVTRTFTVNNSGSAVLTLQTPQLPFGFSLAEPLASQLAPGANDTFTVSFSPLGAGTYSGEISIGNNDSDENPYNFAIQGSVSAPEIGVSGGGVGIDDGDWTPSTADGTNFGMISSGQSVTRTFTVQNSGSATLTLQTPQLPAGFVLTESLVTQLAPGTSDTFSVQFSPVNPGTYSGEISIGNNDSNENPYNFAITGTMGGPEINVLGNGCVIVDGDTVPSAVDGTYFGTVGPAQTVDHTFIVNNTGTALLSLSLRALPAGFILTEPLTSVLAAGGTDSFTVRFAPDIVGQYGGEIIIDNNDADEAPYNFAVFGIRGTPEMDVRGNGVSIADGDNTPSAADDTYFGMTPPNIVASRTFTVRNDGTTTLYLGQVSLGPGSGFRIGSDTLLTQIGPGQSDTFSVELVSSTPGTFVRTVTIYNSDSDECPYDFVIRGIVGIPEIDLTGKGVSIADGDTTPSTTDDTDFGSVLVSTATTTHTLTKTFTVRNTGSGTLYLGTPSVTGTGFWRGAKALRTWLEPGEADTFDVKFSSTTAGTFTGEVILYNSDANEAPYNFAVTAAATAPEIQISGKELQIENHDDTPSVTDGTDFGKVIIGRTTSRFFVIENTGSSTLFLSGLSLPFGFLVGDDPLVANLAPNTSDRFEVKFSPQVLQAYSGRITIVNNDSDESTFEFSIIGQGRLVGDIPDAEIYLDAKKGAQITTIDAAPGTELSLDWRPELLFRQIEPGENTVLLAVNLIETITDTAGVEHPDAVRPDHQQYQLAVRATNGTSTEVSYFNVRFLPIVGLTGDTHVLEGADTMPITFVRRSVDYSESLDVNYSVDWNNVSRDADLTDPSVLPAAAGVIHFAPGQKTATITVKAKTDGAADEEHNGIETFELTVQPGFRYKPFDRRYRLDEVDSERAFTTGDKLLQYTILDGLVAFAGLNDSALKADGSATIHYNDVDQNIRPNCYCAAIMAGMAYKWQSKIRDMIEVLPNGGEFKVTLPGTSATDPWSKTYGVDELLSLGANMLELSGDYDAQQRSEVWPQLIDRALIDYSFTRSSGDGLPPGLWYGSIHTAWYVTTGCSTATWDASTQSIDQFLSDWSGVPVVFTTNAPAEGETLPFDYNTDKPIAGPHAYLFIGLRNVNDIPYVVLYNPWGVSDPRTRNGEVLVHLSQFNLSKFAQIVALKKE